MRKNIRAFLCATALVATCLPTSVQAACRAKAPRIEGAPAILMNQAGFEVGGPVTAILRSRSKAPEKYTVIGETGEEVAMGFTAPFGKSEASGDSVHKVALEGLPAGTYTLESCGERSRPFVVAVAPWSGLADASLNYFYLNRAGEPIDASRAPGPQWAREAGHPSEVLSCFDGEDQTGLTWPGCDYTLDVTGGWYDAGDHGKYAVNGSVASWAIGNMVERLQQRGEQPDRVDALLEEARTNMEFLMALQVPDGATLMLPVGVQDVSDGQSVTLSEVAAGGLVHHKVHAEKWPGIPMEPAKDVATRYLYPPSTQATLNAAATAAQCARIWRESDPAFADRCLAAAKRAYRAAQAHPDISFYHVFDGGGPYVNTELSDEWAWAATELYAATGELDYITGLKDTAGVDWLRRMRDNDMRDQSWSTVDLKPVITMVTAARFSENDRKRATEVLAKMADAYVADAKADGYGVPMQAGDYGWGSSGHVMGRAMTLGAAYDITGETAYRDTIVAGMDYLLGRNPLDQSYIGGFGARPVLNVHHRYWASGYDESYPVAPPGALSGGPNASYDRGEHQKTKLPKDCPAQTCWADDASAYALNEVAINWNAPLVWVATWLDAVPATAAP